MTHSSFAILLRPCTLRLQKSDVSVDNTDTLPVASIFSPTHILAGASTDGGLQLAAYRFKVHTLRLRDECYPPL